MNIRCPWNEKEIVRGTRKADSPIDLPPTTSEADKIPRASSIPADEIGSFYVNISNSSSNSKVTSTGISSKSSYCNRTRIVNSNCSSGNAFTTRYCIKSFDWHQQWFIEHYTNFEKEVFLYHITLTNRGCGTCSGKENSNSGKRSSVCIDIVRDSIA